MNLILFVLLVFLSMAKGRHLVGFGDVLKLAECHKQFDYHRRIPKFDEIMNGLRQSGTKEQMEHYLGPHNQIRVEIDGCMEKNIPELFTFKKSILDQIGINKWLDNEKKRLEGEYDGIGKKKRKNFDNNLETITLNDWRRMLMAFGMAVENFVLAFTKVIIGHFLHTQKDHFPEIEQKTVENLEYLKERMDNQIGSNLKILKMSGYLHHYMWEKDNWLKNFNEMMEELNEKLQSEIGIHPHSSEAEKTLKFELPRIKTVFWVIRHSERFDQKLCPHCKMESKKREFMLDNNGNEFGLDNSPLSEYGKDIAERLLKIFESFKISQAYSSPYFRTLQTLDRLLGPKNLHKLSIKLELAFVEGIRAKRWKDVSKLSYKSCEELNEGKIIKFNNEMNCNYISKVKREELAQEVNGYSELPKEIIEGDFSLLPLIVKALKAILLEEKPSHAHHRHFTHVKNHRWMANGEENAEHIVITTHASVIIAMQQLFAGKFMPIPPDTKFAQIGLSNFSPSTEKARKIGESSAGGNEHLAGLRLMFAKSQYFFLNSQPELEFDAGKLLMASNKVKWIGGLALKAKTELKSVDKFREIAHKMTSMIANGHFDGIILISFGSVVKTNMKEYMNVEQFEAILHTVKAFPQYLFIWQLTENDTRIGKLNAEEANIFSSHWIDQQSILADPRTKAFISHCGRNSQLEAHYYGVPLICVPNFGDQFYNAESSAHHQLAVVLYYNCIEVNQNHHKLMVMANEYNDGKIQKVEQKIIANNECFTSANIRGHLEMIFRQEHHTTIHSKLSQRIDLAKVKKVKEMMQSDGRSPQQILLDAMKKIQLKIAGTKMN